MWNCVILVCRCIWRWWRALVEWERERELACMKCNLSGYLLLFHTFTLGAFPYLRVHIFVRSLYNQPQRTRQREQRVTVRIWKYLPYKHEWVREAKKKNVNWKIQLATLRVFVLCLMLSKWMMECLFGGAKPESISLKTTSRELFKTSKQKISRL